MACNYLRKTKMHKLAQELLPEMPKLIDCHYKFYRGSEWLEFSIGDCFYHLYHENQRITLNVMYYIEDEDKYADVNRICYEYKDGLLVETYNRQKTYESVSQTAEWLRAYRATV